MRLNELTGYKNSNLYKTASSLSTSKGDTDTAYDPNSMEAVNAELKKYGWTFAGKGYYSNVFENPKYDYVLKVFIDPKYEKWLKIISDNQSNPHMPRIRGKSIKLNNEAKAARIEKLQPLTGYDDPILKLYSAPGSDANFDAVFETEEGWNFLSENFPQLIDALNLASASVVGGDLDLNWTNVMKRGNTLVVTDPV